ncbi:MAG: penicillin-binding protein 2 [Pseudomonadota bacterium]
MSDGLRQNISIRTKYDDRRRVQKNADQQIGAGGKFRLRLCAAAFAIVFCGLVARLGYVSFGMADEIRLVKAEVEAPLRPQVVDRNGRPLIMNRDATGLAVDGRDVWDIPEMVDSLSAMFPTMNASRLEKRLAQKQYTLVLENITPQERQDVIALGLPGLKFPSTHRRAYPQGDLAAHVVGYTIPGRGGVVGAEKMLDSYKGALTEEQPIALSIDLVAQQILEDELADAMAVFTAKAAWGILLDVNTGEVRALASLPDYNPNRPGTAKPGAWRNRAMSDVYELGSAFKPITAAAALDAKVVNLSETFDVSQPIEVGGWTIKDYSKNNQPLTVSEIVQRSSNIGTIKIVERLGLDAFIDTLKALHLTTPLRTELPERRKPIVSTTWRPAEFASTSYGHGIAVSPLQLAASFAAVVNGGSYVKPTFLAGGDVSKTSVFSDATSARMRIILRKSVSEGTGRNADAPGFYPIGKTATADKPGVGGYDEDGELVSSFIGAFPGYDPKYVLLISLDEPKGTSATYGFATAGYVAAPVFRRVVERAAPTLGLMPVGDDVAFDGFVGLRKGQDDQQKQVIEHDALATLLSKTAY